MNRLVFMRRSGAHASAHSNIIIPTAGAGAHGRCPSSAHPPRHAAAVTTFGAIIWRVSRQVENILSIMGLLLVFAALGMLVRIKLHTRSPGTVDMGKQQMSSKLSQTQIAQFRETFKSIDTDNSGDVDVRELQVALEKEGTTLSEQEAEELLAQHLQDAELGYSMQILQLKQENASLKAKQRDGEGILCV